MVQQQQLTLRVSSSLFSNIPEGTAVVRAFEMKHTAHTAAVLVASKYTSYRSIISSTVIHIIPGAQHQQYTRSRIIGVVVRRNGVFFQLI